MKNTETKECTNCGVTKSLDSFKVDGRTSDQLSNICIKCKRVKEEVSRTKRKQKYRQGKGKDRKKEWLKYLYNLTKEDYYSILENQNHSCKICGTHESKVFKQTLFVDHCHTTGKVRGLLCNSCNTGLGRFKDSQDILQKAIGYLNESSY